MIKVSDLVANILEGLEVKSVFGVTGGASIHLMHSFRSNPKIEMVACHHEQGASMSADGFARSTNWIGCAVATSGPGASNLITGILCSWCDSIPVLYITGQVATFRMKGNLKVRQYGFQETDIVGMVSGITKYAYQIRNKNEIYQVFIDAITEMLTGRPGPALIDIPDDIQRELIDNELFKTEDLRRSIEIRVLQKNSETFKKDSTLDLESILKMIQNSQRPICVIGGGVSSLESRKQIKYFLEKSQIPVVTTWAAKDIVSSTYKWNCGSFGTHGTRVGNFAVQNADLVLTFGTRLSTKETGTPATDWARSAKFVMVDIDSNEIEKFASLGKKVTKGINYPVLEVLLKLNNLLNSFSIPEVIEWKNQIAKWKNTFTKIEVPEISMNDGITAIDFVDFIKKMTNQNTDIFVDTGCAVAWLMQGLELPDGARLFHDCNNTAMGWALPAAIGGMLANPNRHIICVVGDGSLMMNVQELSTLKYLNSKIDIVLIDNNGYAMVRQTEKQWLNNNHVGTDHTDLNFPDFTKLFDAFGFPSLSLTDKNGIQDINQNRILQSSQAYILRMDENCGVFPQASFGFPIEDSEPFLPKNIFLENMIIEAKDVSKNRE